MNNNNGRLSYGVSLDNSQLRTGANESKRILSGIGQTAVDEGRRIDDTMNRIGKTVAGVFAVAQMKEFVTNVANVRGEFQKLEISFKTMLGSEEKAVRLMDQLVKTAATTPFSMRDIANSAKQLLAYGLEAEKVNDTLIRLGDIAAGLSIPINDLAYLYGTTMVQGRLYTQDLNQFLGRGIPLMAELAKQFGVAESEVKKLVEEGKVGFPQVQQAIVNLTSEGSKFGGLMEAQSKTIAGQISNIEDQIEQMFNEIGKSSEGAISGALSVTSEVIEHWEEIGKVLLTVIATYGAYKAAVIAVAAAHKLMALWQTAQAFLSLVPAITSAKDAMILFNMVCRANPLGLVLSVLAAAVTAFALFADTQDDTEEAIKNVNERIKAQEQELKELQKSEDAVLEAKKNAAKSTAEEISKIESLNKTIHDETASLNDRKKALTQMQAIVPKYHAELDTEGRLHRDNTEAIEAHIESLNRLAVAKALQAKREEIVARRITAELERGKAQENVSGATKKRDAAQAVVSRKQASYNSRMRELDNATGKGDDGFLYNMFVGEAFASTEGQITYSTTAKKYRKSLDDAEKVLRLRTSELQAATNEVRKQDLIISQSNSQLTDIDNMMKNYGAYLPSTNTGGGSGSGGSGGSGGGSKDNKQALADAAAQRALNIREYAENVKSEVIQAELDIRQAQIDAMDEGFEKSIAQVKLNYDRLTGKNLEREKKMIEDLKDKKVLEWQNENPKATKEEQLTYSNSLLDDKNPNHLTAEDLTKEQQAMLNSYADIAEKIKNKELKDLYGAGQQAMLEHLRQYGTFKQQQLAIATEYAAKIKAVEQSSDTEEQKKWKIASIKKEQQQTEQQIETSAIMARIDWYQVFGNVGGIMKDVLTPLLEDLKAYVSTDKFQHLAADQQKQIIDAMANIRQQVGTTGDVGWRNLAADLSAYQEALRDVTDATKAYKDLETQLLPKLEAAQKRLGTAQSNPNSSPSDIQAIQDEISSIMQQLTESGEKVAKANTSVTTSGQKLAQTTEAVTQPIDSIYTFLQGSGLTQIQELWGGIMQLKGGIDGLKSLKEVADSAGDAAKGAAQMGKDMAEVGESVTDVLAKGFEKAGFIGQIIAAVLKIFDILKDGISPLITGIIDSILNAINGILEELFNGKLIGNIASSVVIGVGSILDTITGAIGSVISFGALSSGGISDWVTNSNGKWVAETIERLTIQSEALQHSIDKLRDSIDKNYGGKAISDYMEALEAQNKQNEAKRQMLMAMQAYHGSHHSNQHYWNMGYEYTTMVNELLGTNLRMNVWDDWGNLTAEQMEMIRTYLPEVWQAMLMQGKYRTGDYFEDYADQAGKIEELTEKIKENLLGTSFEGLRDSFIDGLMDMSKSAEDFSTDLTEMLQRALLKAAIAGRFDEQLEKWYNSVTDAMMNEDGTFNELTEEQLQYYRDWWNAMTSGMIEERDRLAELTGYTDETNREAAQKGIATASQESVDELNGRATAIQGHTYSISENTKLLVENTNLILRSVLNIERNTDDVPQRLANLELSVKAVKDTVNDIAIKGIRIKT